MSAEWLEEVIHAYHCMARHSDSYEFAFDDIVLTVDPGVFSPTYFTDSFLFARHVAAIAQGKRLLEIGTGTGIVSLLAGLNGASGVATDINPRAVANAQKNFAQYSIDFEARLGDMYGPIHKDESFDFIFWNHPFNAIKPPEALDDVDRDLLTAGFDPGYHNLDAFLAGATTYLRDDDSRVLLGTGGDNDEDRIRSLVRGHGYRLSSQYIEAPVAPQREAATLFALLTLLPGK